MKHIRPFSLYESDDPDSLIRVANQFISDLSKVYDLRFGKPFDKNKANCAWFTIQFFNWAKAEGLDVKVAYFDSDVEAHIAPVLNGKIIDFAVKQFTGNPNDNYLILNPEDYQNYGYQTFEIYDELPELETVFPADKLK